MGGLNNILGNSFYTCSLSGKEGTSDSPIKVAEEVMAKLPMKRLAFICLHCYAGVRIVRGLIYAEHDYGIFFIEEWNGVVKKVILNEGQLQLVQ